MQDTGQAYRGQTEVIGGQVGRETKVYKKTHHTLETGDGSRTV